jgi:hypothetical protein
VITVTYTPTFDLLDALIDQDAKRRSVSADQLAVTLHAQNCIVTSDVLSQNLR